MGLPFLKHKEGAASSPVESLERKPDDQPDMDMLDACAHDILDAVERKDHAGLKQALQCLVNHIQDQDKQQDANQEDMQ